MSNPRDFLFTTEYPIDKIVYMGEGEWNPTDGEWDDETGHYKGERIIQTDFGAVNMVVGEWTDDDWVTAYPIASTKYIGGWYRRDSQSLIYEKYVNVTMYGSSSGFYIRCISSYTDKIKYRFYSFLSEQYLEANVNPTASLSNKLVLDTRENYPKLFEDKIIHLTGGTPYTYYHNLGFRPFIRAWNGLVNDDGTGVFEPTCYSIQEITESYIRMFSSYDLDIYLRVYCDEIE